MGLLDMDNWMDWIGLDGMGLDRIIGWDYWILYLDGFLFSKL